MKAIQIVPNLGKIDIDAQLMSLVHSQVIETTKQHAIMNIDNPLTEEELSTKLKKLNKLTSSIIQGSTQLNKTLLTKGLLDTYRVIIESSIKQSNATLRSQSISGQMQLPIILAFKQCTPQLLQLLSDYEQNKRITLVLDSLCNQTSTNLEALKDTIKRINNSDTKPRITMICFPMVDYLTGAILLTDKVVSFVRDIKITDNWFLDTSAGINILHNRFEHNLQNLRDTMPFDFWSIDCNQINGTTKTGLLMFKSDKMNQLLTYETKKPGEGLYQQSQPVMADSVFSVYNSLQVFLCNRNPKNKRIARMKRDLLYSLQNDGILLAVRPKALQLDSNSKIIPLLNTICLQHINNPKLLKQQQNKTKSGLVVIYWTELDTQEILVNKDQELANVLLFSLVYVEHEQVYALPITMLQSVLKMYQVFVQLIDPTQLYFLDPVKDKSIFASTCQISMNDLTFNYVIRQLYSALFDINRRIKSVSDPQRLRGQIPSPPFK